MAKKIQKTNAMRILDSHKEDYKFHPYDEELTNAVDVANALNQDPLRLFKTLVTVAKSKEHYVFMVPGEKELDLKKAAKAANEKSLEMIHLKELLPLTGYIHGGCSPVGMKKQFKTFIDESAKDFETIYFSAGKRGLQIEMSLKNLEDVIDVKSADLTKDH